VLVQDARDYYNGVLEMAGVDESPQVLVASQDAAQRLLQRVADLRRRYELADPDVEQSRIEALEASALAAVGLDTTAYLVCLALCVARCTAGGPIMTTGLWSRSALVLGFIAAQADPESPTKRDGLGGDAESPMFSVLIMREPSKAPIVLSAGSPSHEFLQAFSHEVGQGGMDIEHMPGPAHHFVATSAFLPQPLLTIAEAENTADFRGEEASSSGAFIWQPSTLLKCLVLGCAQVERSDGDHVDPVALLNAPASLGEPMATVWLSLLPELPPLSDPLDTAVSAAALYNNWLTSLPSDLPASARLTLQLKLGIVCALSLLKRQYPGPAWASLLSCTAQANVAGAVNQARIEGLRMLQPDVNLSDVDWNYVSSEETPLMRVGLGAIVSTDVALTIVRNRRQVGPFTSIADLKDRLPAVFENSSLLRNLVLARCFSEWHERGTLLDLWPTLVARPAAIPEGSESVPVTTDPDGQTALADWHVTALVQIAGLAWLDGSSSALKLPEMALGVYWPRDLGEFATKPDQIVLLHGLYYGHRLLKHDGTTYSVLELTDGFAVVPVAQIDEEGTSCCYRLGQLLEVRVVLRSVGGHILCLDERLVFARPERRLVAIRVELTGEKHQDLELLDGVYSIVSRYPGDIAVQFFLVQGLRVREWSGAGSLTVSWSPSLRSELEVLLGPGCVSVDAEVRIPLVTAHDS